jgi:hypothetical protein
MIYFSNKKMMDNIVWSTNETAAYFPSNLFNFEKKLKDNITTIKSDYPQTKTELDSDLKKNIEKYNIIIGGFSFSKLLRSNYVDPNLTYSNSYFELYKTIQIEFDRLELDNSNHQNKFSGLFNNKESNWFKFKKHIDKCINNEYVIALASDKNIQLVEKFNIIQYDLNINDEEIYVLIILAFYNARL